MQKPSTSLIDRLREHKLLWNLLLIVVIILAMADRFREAGFVVGVAKGLVRRWSEGR